MTPGTAHDSTPGALPIHAESPLHIPLVRHMMEDPHVTIFPRAIDLQWKYDEIIDRSVGGFSPQELSVFVGARSALAAWLAAPHQSIRPHNLADRAFTELQMAVHDYLHCWAYLAIDTLRPDLGFGTALVTPENLEDFAFCHTLSETAATVGLDYWYFARLNVNDVIDIGTSAGPLTNGYHDRHLREYRRWCPSFDVHQPGFFKHHARFYCDGRFRGFPLAAVDHSPLLLKWLNHEVKYGIRQRLFTRTWLKYLSEGRCTLDPRTLDRPIDIDADWKSSMIVALGEMLWDKVIHDKQHTFASAAAYCAKPKWSNGRRSGSNNFFLINVNELSDEELLLRAGGLPPDSFDMMVSQYLSAHRFSSFDPELIAPIAALRKQRDFGALVALLRSGERVKRDRPEPADVFFYG